MRRYLAPIQPFFKLNNLCVFLIVHVPGNNGSSQPSVPILITSGADTPSSSSSQDVASKANRNGSLGTGTSTPTNVKDGTLFFECVSCSRQVRCFPFIKPQRLELMPVFFRLHRTDMHLISVHVWVLIPPEGVQCEEMSSQS